MSQNRYEDTRLKPTNEIHPTLPIHMRANADEMKLKHRASDPSFTGMKVYSAQDRERMPWMNDHIDLTTGHNGIKRIYYGEQGNKHDFNQQLQR